MSGKVYKKIEIVGESETGISDAIASAIEKAGKTLHSLNWFEVQEIRGYIKDNKPGYQVTLKVGFRLDE